MKSAGGRAIGRIGNDWAARGVLLMLFPDLRVRFDSIPNQECKGAKGLSDWRPCLTRHAGTII
jgi:hypothetical protein